MQLFCGTCKKAKHLGWTFGKLNVCKFPTKA